MLALRAVFPQVVERKEPHLSPLSPNTAERMLLILGVLVALLALLVLAVRLWNVGAP